MALPLGIKAQVGDILSPSSQASANPVDTLTFTPTLTIIAGSPDSSLMARQSNASTPTIDAPVGINRPQQAAFGADNWGAADIPMLDGLGNVMNKKKAGQAQKSNAVPLLSSLTSSPLLLVAVAGVAIVFLMKGK